MAYETTITIPENKLYLGSAAGGLTVSAALVGILGFAVAAYFGLRDPANAQLTTHFWHAYLLSFSFFLAITLGALFFVMVHHATRAGWSVLVRRIAEGLASNMLLMGLLFLPMVCLAATGKLTVLYHWADPTLTDPNGHHFDQILAGKKPYLNLTFWLVRLIGFLVLWTALALFMRSTSIRQDASGDVALSKRMEKASYPGLIFFAVSLTLAAFDLLMTLNPHWFSTMWGVYYFATCALAFFSSLVLVTLTLQKRGLLPGLINQEHFHDLGKWMFAFTFFWGYIAFSQYMLIWYANIPEETQFYIPRQIGPWGALALGLVFVHLAIPFLGMISRHVKRKTAVLAFWAVWSLLACLADLFWVIMPNAFINKIGEVVGDAHMPLQQSLPKLVQSNTGVGGPGIYGLHPDHQAFWHHVTFPLYSPEAWVVTVALLIGMAGLYVASTMTWLKGAALVPLKDPRLPESVAFENA